MSLSIETCLMNSDDIIDPFTDPFYNAIYYKSMWDDRSTKLQKTILMSFFFTGVKLNCKQLSRF